MSKVVLGIDHSHVRVPDEADLAAMHARMLDLAKRISALEGPAEKDEPKSKKSDKS